MKNEKKKSHLCTPFIFWISLALVLSIIITLYWVIGCSINTPSYSQDDSFINIGIGKQFIILFDLDLATGCSWYPDYDIQMLELAEKTYRKGEHTRPELKKSDFSGVEYFTFKALKKGETNITFAYEKVGEEEVIKQKIFTVSVK